MSIELVWADKPLQEAANHLRDNHVILYFSNRVTLDVAMSKAHTAFNENGNRAIKLPRLDVLNVHMPKGLRRLTFSVAETQNVVYHMYENLKIDIETMAQPIVVVASRKIAPYIDTRTLPVRPK